MAIKAHYDGKTIVPDEPLDLPAGTPVDAVLTIVESKLESLSEREKAWQHLLSLRIPDVCIPLEALQRENMYEDRGV